MVVALGNPQFVMVTMTVWIGVMKKKRNALVLILKCDVLLFLHHVRLGHQEIVRFKF